MSVLSNTQPSTDDSIGITCMKWLQSIRTQKGITSASTSPNTRDSVGETLMKILTIYNA